MHKSPKTRFLEEQGLSRHQELVVSEWFLHSLDMAMLELQNNMPRGGNVNDAASAGLRMEGALEFRRILENLGESPKLQTSTYALPPQLNPNA